MMKLKHWTIISQEEAALIVKYLNPIDVINLEERGAVHRLRRRLIEEIGKMETREIIWDAKQRLEGAE